MANAHKRADYHSVIIVAGDYGVLILNTDSWVFVFYAVTHVHIGLCEHMF